MSVSKKINLVTTLSDNYKKIIPRNIIKNYKELDWNNGLGNRWCNKQFNYTVIYKNKEKTYSENENDKIPKELLETFKQNYNDNDGIIGIFVHSKKIIKENNRPINKKIRKHFINIPCVVCGTTSDLIVDHKNYLYNDSKVLNNETQQINDFQSLCNHCNLQKRQISIKEKELKKIYSAKNLPLFQYIPFIFPWEQYHYNENDYTIISNTFWYDPSEFQKKIYYYSSYIYPIINEIKFKIKNNKLKLYP
jgi:excinuclease UvrABC ATPase subunit